MHAYTIFVLILSFILVVSLGLIEMFLHRRRLKKIPIRIHVNGTRGKSSVTRLIASGLRAGGIKTCAKTTGTLPKVITPDGREFPVFRPGRTNVIEQLRIVKFASSYGVDAIVMECMALQPLLQWLCESKLVRATHGVITNAREDHLDVMGPTEADVAKALAATVPVKAKFFTAEQRNLGIFELATTDRQTTLIPSTSADTEAVTDQEMSFFSYIEHKENVALALKVCSDLGVDRQTALKGMYEATPDAGALSFHELDFFGRHLVFFNAFAANDPESTEKLWNIALEKTTHKQVKIALFNCRQDRADRSLQLARAVCSWKDVDAVVLMGTGTYFFAKEAVREGFSYGKIYFADYPSVEEIFETLLEIGGNSATIVGMGNIGGQGLDVVQFFKNRAVVE